MVVIFRSFPKLKVIILFPFLKSILLHTIKAKQANCNKNRCFIIATGFYDNLRSILLVFCVLLRNKKAYAFLLPSLLQ